MIQKITCGTLEKQFDGSVTRQRDFSLDVKNPENGRLLDSNSQMFAELTADLLQPFLEKMQKLLDAPHPVGEPDPGVYAEILTNDGAVHDVRGCGLEMEFAELMAAADQAGCVHCLINEKYMQPMGLVAYKPIPPGPQNLTTMGMGILGTGIMAAASGIFDTNGTRNPDGTWNCGCGAKNNTTKFCPECGGKAPDAAWKCPNCGKEQLTCKFCPDCGTPRT